MPIVSDSSAFVLEIMLAFVLVFVILHVAKGSKEQGMFAGIAIGSTVLLEVLFGMMLLFMQQITTVVGMILDSLVD